MTGPEGAPAVPARPDEQAVAEALAEMRQHPQWVEKLGDVSKVIVRAALAAGPDEPLRAFAAWLVGMDNPEDVIGRERRRTVTLTQIIDRARAALAAARPAAGPVHDNRCEAEYVHEAPGWTECSCDRRASARPAAEPDVVDAASREMQRHHIDPDHRDPDRNDRCVCGRWASGEMSPGWDDHLAEELGNAGLLASPLPTGAAHQQDGEGSGTGDGTTETRTEYRVKWSDGKTHEWADLESCQRFLEDHRRSGPGRIESREITTTTTRTVTPWEAQ